MASVMVMAGSAAGALLAPWLRALAFRLSVPSGEPDRTRCPGCDRELVSDRHRHSLLSPTGRCPGCGDRIGPPAGTMELAAAALTGAVGGAIGPRPELLAFAFLALLAVPLAFIDIAVHRLPDRLTLPAYPILAGLLTVAALAGGEPHRIAGVLIGGLVAGVGYLALVLIRPDQLGLGDAKLAGLLGLALGWWGLSAVVLACALAFVLSGILGLALLVTRRASLDSDLPLGPFLVAGAFAVLLGTTGW
ncbi:A24 family peptidase [Nocardioides sp. NPDC127514]|uniref:A24 family peptidase n=1 Tax=unclassified Nocardioides TaxID=2615069 RepID=UPI00332A57A2